MSIHTNLNDIDEIFETDTGYELDQAVDGNSDDCEYEDQEYLIINDFDHNDSKNKLFTETKHPNETKIISIEYGQKLLSLQDATFRVDFLNPNCNGDERSEYDFEDVEATAPVALDEPTQINDNNIDASSVNQSTDETSKNNSGKCIKNEVRCKQNSVASQTTRVSFKDYKGPRRYMLFDDLVATVVDFDEDNTPIVEFTLSNTTTEELPIECGICPDIMAKIKLNKHLETHLVPGTNRYACLYCDETYRDSKYLAGHARRHMGIRPYKCNICNLYFSTKQDLRVHNQRRHLEKEHTCEICGKTFAQNTQLKRHRESTHEKKRRFKCEFCPKGYYKNFSLQEHIRNVHMGKRRMLVCPFCGMECRDAHKMARHRKQMHLNQSSFTCIICQEEFTDINYFDAHKRSIQCRNNTKRLQTGNNQQQDAKMNDTLETESQDDLNDFNCEIESELDDGCVIETEEDTQFQISNEDLFLDDDAFIDDIIEEDPDTEN